MHRRAGGCAQILEAEAHKVWAAGRYTDAAELDCVGLIIRSWSAVKVVFGFGRQYDRSATSAAPSTYILSSGDPFAVRVKSATFRGTARLSGQRAGISRRSASRAPA